MTNTSFTEFLLSIAQSLGHPSLQAAPLRPLLPIAPGCEDLEQGLDIFFKELVKLSAESLRLHRADIGTALSELVSRYRIQKAAMWHDDHTAQYALEKMMIALGVQLAPQDADKYALAACDLGITTVDFFIPDTGTIGLLASAQKPRPVSLLPRVHLALLTSANLRPSLSHALEEFKNHRYLTLITGPSRTSDIELTLTLGVHGPGHLVIWYIEDV